MYFHRPFSGALTQLNHSISSIYRCTLATFDALTPPRAVSERCDLSADGEWSHSESLRLSEKRRAKATIATENGLNILLFIWLNGLSAKMKQIIKQANEFYPTLHQMDRKGYFGCFSRSLLSLFLSLCASCKCTTTQLTVAIRSQIKSNVY